MENEVCAHERQAKLDGPFGPHAIKVICKDCLRFLSWGESPEKTEARADMQGICVLLLSGDLSEWERGFVESVKKQKRLSEKQLTVFERIRKKYLKGDEVPASVAPPRSDEDFGLF